MYPVFNFLHRVEQQMLLEKRRSQQSMDNDQEVKQLQAKLAKMQIALDESYDIIDEMDFELESVIKKDILNFISIVCLIASHS